MAFNRSVIVAFEIQFALLARSASTGSQLPRWLARSSSP